MDISVPSRFACLKIEDDDSRPVMNKKKSDNKLIKKNNPKKSDLSVHSSATKQNPSSSKKQKTKQHEKQWEDWKKKDSEMINDNFEQDLENAILLSKLDFEAKKSVNGVVKLDGNRQVSCNVNKKKKSKTMYLSDFLSGPETKESNGDVGDKEEKDTGEAFFEKMVELSKKEVTKGKLEEERKEREVDIEKIISIAQCQEKLKLEQERNAELQQQLDEAKAEVTTVKARNKMLCNILGHGEMRDKAEILIELERLNVVRDELTEELGHLHKLLEQERSKSASLDPQNSKHKDKKRKKVGC